MSTDAGACVVCVSYHLRAKHTLALGYPLAPSLLLVTRTVWRRSVHSSVRPKCLGCVSHASVDSSWSVGGLELAGHSARASTCSGLTPLLQVRWRPWCFVSRHESLWGCGLWRRREGVPQRHAHVCLSPFVRISGCIPSFTRNRMHDSTDIRHRSSPVPSETGLSSTLEVSSRAVIAPPLTWYAAYLQFLAANVQSQSMKPINAYKNNASKIGDGNVTLKLTETRTACESARRWHRASS